ncbi:hypothetical protein [Phycisphaera mikurensis]|uniref:Uncharacterized protein n=1 Tax=Phycisphaera mikurensis (strain NBRC 102666 / KCTC 22515 / FYK2301M01) TaxID=1142394 RepID=I0IBZ0_PHYMF|nr:hypothetical protein [Phycisphaera mikurensis]MBB6441998.1 hypothetical protein [Phycisphaera mikurensis]BAM02778.1 hypothetical protein PSMK_06190 [Phycisphaera mikurensis NBRC 102666]
MRNLPNPAALIAAAAAAALCLGLASGCATSGTDAGVQDDSELRVLDDTGKVDDGGLGDRN